MRSLLAATCVAVTLALPTAAHAGACCLSVGAYGLGRLAPYEHASVTLDAGGGSELAYWDAGGGLHDVAATGHTDSGSATLGALVRVSSGGSAWLRLPWLATARSQRRGHGLGDLDLGLRVDWLEVGGGAPVGVATSLGVVAPTGTSTGASRDPSGVDVTGRGQWALAASVAVERTALPVFVRATLGGRLAVADRDGWRDGPALDLELAAGRALDSGLLLSAIASQTLRAASTFAGRSFPASSARRLRLAVGAAYPLTPRWTLRAGAAVSPPLGALGRNEVSDWSLTVGLRRGVILGG